MADNFIGEIRAVGFSFAPVGWAFCNGQLILITDNGALFNLIGTTYGGDGVTNFALPNIQSRVLIGQGLGPGLTSFTLGQMAGGEIVSISTSQLPGHNHGVTGADTPGSSNSPVNGVFSSPNVGGPVHDLFSASTDSTFATDALQVSGNSLSHTNLQPYLAIYYIIALTGLTPSQN
jgi:microcystin-dependent protein